MGKTIDITHGVEPFNEHIDTSRNNPDRKQWGRGDTDFHISAEYDPPQQEEPSPPAPPEKFTHKLSNGTVLEASSIEELASKIEKSIQPVATETKWDDTPAYQPMEFKPRELTVQEKAMLLNQWGQDPQKVTRAIQEAEFGATMEQIIARLNRMEMREAERAQEVAGVEFLAECAETYNATPANAKKLTEFLKTKQKPITKNNLVNAFRELSATDEALLRKQTDEEPEEPNEPPTIVSSNQGLPPASPPQGVDMDKFSKMSLNEMKQAFAKVRAGR